MIGFVLFILFLLLVFSLFLTQIKESRFAKWAVFFRWCTVILTVTVFTFWFFNRSVSKYQENSLTTQVINKLPVTLDVYLIKIDKKNSQKYVVKHIGKIRPEHYRIEYLKMDNSDEFWVAGFLGKTNMVYFSQRAVPNKNMDQIVDINNYIVQSAKLSAVAKTQIEEEQYGNILLSIWVSLNLLLLFLNLVLLLRGK